jgi:hypothetical protein
MFDYLDIDFARQVLNTNLGDGLNEVPTAVIYSGDAC